MVELPEYEKYKEKKEKRINKIKLKKIDFLLKYNEIDDWITNINFGNLKKLKTPKHQ